MQLLLLLAVASAVQVRDDYEEPSENTMQRQKKMMIGGAAIGGVALTGLAIWLLRGGEDTDASVEALRKELLDKKHLDNKHLNNARDHLRKQVAKALLELVDAAPKDKDGHHVLQHEKDGKTYNTSLQEVAVIAEAAEGSLLKALLRLNKKSECKNAKQTSKLIECENEDEKNFKSNKDLIQKAIDQSVFETLAQTLISADFNGADSLKKKVDNADPKDKVQKLNEAVDEACKAVNFKKAKKAVREQELEGKVCWKLVKLDDNLKAVKAQHEMYVAALKEAQKLNEKVKKAEDDKKDEAKALWKNEKFEPVWGDKCDVKVKSGAKDIKPENIEKAQEVLIGAKAEDMKEKQKGKIPKLFGKATVVSSKDFEEHFKIDMK